MSESDNLLFKNTLIYALGDIIPKVLNFITFPILTKNISVSEYGIINYINSIEIFLSIITFLGLKTYYLVYYYRIGGETERKKLLGNLSIFVIIINIVITLILFLVGNNLFLAIGSQIKFYPYIATGILINFFNVFTILPSALYRVKENPLPLTLLNILKGIIIMCLTWFIVIRIPTAESVLYIRLVVYVFFAILFFIITYRNSIWQIDKRQIISALKFSLPLVPGDIAYYLSTMSDRILIEKYLSTIELGLYSTASTIALTLNIVSYGAYRAFEPYFFKTYGEPDFKNDFNRIRDIFFAVILIFGVCISIFTPEFLTLFSSQEYYKSYYYVPVIVIGVIFNAVSMMYSTIATAQLKTKKCAFISISCSLISVVLNNLLLPRFGLVSAPIVFTLIFIINFLMIKYITGFPWHNALKLFCSLILSCTCVYILLKINYSNLVYSVLVKSGCVFLLSIVLINMLKIRVQTIFNQIKIIR